VCLGPLKRFCCFHCLTTVDHQTMGVCAVTLRDRDSLEQTRLPIAEPPSGLTSRLGEPWTRLRLTPASGRG
jgi:glycyl-tRNA synthetase (class II)